MRHSGEPLENSIHSQIVTNYHSITSCPNSTREADYSAKTRGLRRGLRDWLDVKSQVVLDLGCGTGELCWLAKKNGASSITGINLSQGEIDYARERVDAEFVCEDILHFLASTPAKSVDRIFALNILEHLSKDSIALVLEHCQRILRPSGYIVAMVPNAISPFGTMTRYWDITHQLSFTPSSIRQLMRLSKFHDVRFREWGPRPYNLISTVRFVIWQLFRVAIAFRLMVETGSTKGGIYTADMIFRLTKA